MTTKENSTPQQRMDDVFPPNPDLTAQEIEELQPAVIKLLRDAGAKYPCHDESEFLNQVDCLFVMARRTLPSESATKTNQSFRNTEELHSLVYSHIPGPTQLRNAAAAAIVRDLQASASVESASALSWRTETPTKEALYVVRDVDGQMCFAEWSRRYGWEHTADNDCGAVASWYPLPDPQREEAR